MVLEIGKPPDVYSFTSCSRYYKFAFYEKLQNFQAFRPHQIKILGDFDARAVKISLDGVQQGFNEYTTIESDDEANMNSWHQKNTKINNNTKNSETKEKLNIED